MMAVVVLPGLIDTLLNVVLKPAGKVIPEMDRERLPLPVEALEMVIVAWAFVPMRMVPKLKLPLTEMVLIFGPALAVCAGTTRQRIARVVVMNEEKRRFSSGIVLAIIQFYPPEPHQDNSRNPQGIRPPPFKMTVNRF